jgi:hypothetical protein
MQLQLANMPLLIHSRSSQNTTSFGYIERPILGSYNLFQIKILSLILICTLLLFGSIVDCPKQSVFARVLLKEGLRSVVLVGKLETMTNGLVGNT